MTSKITSHLFEDSIEKEVSRVTLKEINERMGTIEHVTSLAIATLLDPRLKIMHFTDLIACANAIQKNQGNS